MRAVAASLSFLMAVVPGTSLAADCGLQNTFSHTVKVGKDKFEQRPIFQGESGSRAFFFTTNFAVNTDGAPNSYHPDDPGGNGGKAINTICNGVNVHKQDRTKLDYRNCSELITQYRLAKASGWAVSGVPRVDFYGIATSDGNRFGQPCIISEGPFAGYFVSQTALPADTSRPFCDQARYLNALDLPFTIVPRNSRFTAQGVGRGDAVVLFNPQTAVLEYAVVGDIGPSDGLGEASVFLANSLRKKQVLPRTRKETYNLAVTKVHALFLPDARISPPYTLSRIREEGANAFQAWGGRARLDACIAEHGNPSGRR